MKKLLVVLVIALSGCSSIQSIKEYWPRDHDPVMFNNLIRVEFNIAHIDCEKPDWNPAIAEAEMLSKYTEYRGDPQRKNIKGLYEHTVRMNKGGSKTFCELGKKTAQQRINAAMAAWKGR